MKLSYLHHESLVLLPIVILGIIACLIFFERLFFLHRGYIRSRQFLEGSKNLISKGRIVEAITICEETSGPIASILKAALVHYKEPVADIVHHMQAVALVEVPLLERRLGSLHAIASTAPLFGLLGTSIAFFKAFKTVSSEGSYAYVASFYTHVASALTSTIASLILAACAYLGYYFLSARVRGIINDVEFFSSEILLLLKRVKANDIPSQDTL